jgi:chemotaxis response regulator CheB
MTPAQLELRRLRELRSGARKARHLVHAMRTPLARLVTFERRAVQAFNRPLVKLERLKDGADFARYEPSDHREMVVHLLNLAEQLEKDEKRIKTAKPLEPIEQRIAARKKKAERARKAEAEEAAKNKAWGEKVRTTIEPMIAASASGPAQVRQVLAAIKVSPRNNSAQNRAILRHYGSSDWAEALLELSKENPNP